MSMMHKLFRPEPGQKLRRFVQAFVNGTGVYRGDLVCWDITAPTLQGGTAGTVEGNTMGANDFLYVILPPAAITAARGLQAGGIEGTTIDDDATNATAQTNDDLAIVQTWGVKDDVWVDSTDTAAGNLLVTGATTGEWTRALGTDFDGTDATVGADGYIAGFALAADAATWTRGTVATEESAPAFIRCDW